MKTLKTMLTVILALGVVLFVLPVGVIAHPPASGGSMGTLQAWLMCLSGLLTITCTLWLQDMLRRRESTQVEKVSRNNQVVERMMRLEKSGRTRSEERMIFRSGL